ncbi:MAG: ubiquinone/menaquinone biosynthesis C-methylase UbiE [Roseivirga sp.]
MSNNFNTIAPVYDFLAKMVFGRSLERAQAAFLSELEPKVKAKVLIVGGGTGRILELLPEGLDLQIDYVEMSKGMLERAKGRVSKGNHVQLICEDIRKVNGQYDFVITNFFLDCFEVDKLDGVMVHICALLKEDGHWLVTDFAQPTNARQRILLWTMHTFFQLVARLESKKLQDIKSRLGYVGLIISKEAFFSKRLIFSAVFRKH